MSSPKSFRNSWGSSCIRCVTCGERKIWSNIKKSQIITTKFSEFFFLLFMLLLTVPVVKNDHILVGVYFNFLREPPRSNLEGFSIPTFDFRDSLVLDTLDTLVFH